MYRPAGGGPYPALLDVHGGAWSGNHRFANTELDRTLAATGMVVVAIDFRLAPQDPYPAMVQDVNYATRWIKRNAPALGVRAGPVGALGTSSGGHLVLLSAVRPFDPRYAALPLPPGRAPTPRSATSSPAGPRSTPTCATSSPGRPGGTIWWRPPSAASARRR